MSQPSFLQLIPEYRDYVWGGERLRPGIVPTAEAWVVTESARIATGPLAGKTLSHVADVLGSDLLGAVPFQRTGRHFPLLVKLLDCAQWLSLQVHPNDEQALEIEGPRQHGKTEAWHVLEATPGAEIIAGLKPGLTSASLEVAMRDGSIIDRVNYLPVRSGDTIFMPAGTLHALGPGLLVYEVQQNSDWTYRVYDWGRPQSEKRPLHIQKSSRVIHLESTIQPLSLPSIPDDGQLLLANCPYFSLEMLICRFRPMQLATHNLSFHALTVIEGAAQLTSSHDQVELRPYQTAIVPAGLGGYQLQPIQPCRVLKASVEST